MNTVDDRDSIVFLDLSYLTDKLRDIASKVLPKDRYGIMTQQSIIDRLGSQERAIKECKEAICLADLGRKINADYIAQGHIGRFSGELTIKVELYNVGNSNLIGAFTGDSKNLKGLLSVLEEKAPKLFEEMLRTSSPPSPVPVPSLLRNPSRDFMLKVEEKEFAESTRKIKGDFEDLGDFYLAAQAGFSKYFKRYSPKLLSKDKKSLVMTATYGKHPVLCTFYQNENSQYFVTIDTKFDRDRIKWLENVVKHTEKRGK